MRVIAGSARRLQLKTPEGMETRPTTDRVKESLFNMLNPDICDCRFLDLFSGSGAIGIEALSRGAEKAVFVDKSKICTDVIKENLKFTRLEENTEVINGDVIDTIYKLGRENAIFDIIFMDPPYAAGFYEPVLKSIITEGILSENGYLVAESANDYDFPLINGFKITKRRKCGPAVMTFLYLGEEKC
ncbi:Ribosomal RNA small subunit methyltransferase D [bioreactor metagenome]|uniref:Ribosomal RNA small subunit methyltransferase D n=1 Tax=bioreactor metagenome TaxID=1076179 RepID=A0A645ARW3_9ZZZZ